MSKSINIDVSGVDAVIGFAFPGCDRYGYLAPDGTVTGESSEARGFPGPACARIGMADVPPTRRPFAFVASRLARLA